MLIIRMPLQSLPPSQTCISLPTYLSLASCLSGSLGLPVSASSGRLHHACLFILLHGVQDRGSRFADVSDEGGSYEEAVVVQGGGQC